MKTLGTDTMLGKVVLMIPLRKCYPLSVSTNLSAQIVLETDKQVDKL